MGVSAVARRELLPAIRTPTLVLHGEVDRLNPVEMGRWTAEQIPGALFYALKGRSHMFPGTATAEVYASLPDLGYRHRFRTQGNPKRAGRPLPPHSPCLWQPQELARRDADGRLPDPPIRVLYARLYRLANRVWFGVRVRDIDCACKLFRRDALEGIRVESSGAFFSEELLIKRAASGRRVVEVGLPHYPRTAGSPTGAKPSVIRCAVKDFWRLRGRTAGALARDTDAGRRLGAGSAPGVSPASG